MDENKKDSTVYKTIEDIHVYVQEIENGGAQIIIAEKTARIAARAGVPGEHIISWSADANGLEVMEKDAIVSVDPETGIPGWVATKVDEKGNEIMDQNGHINQWIIDNITFQKKYEADPEHEGIYKPVGGPQKFIQLNEGIQIIQWCEEWYVDAGGYINITNINDIYVISGRDFDDTYRVIYQK